MIQKNKKRENCGSGKNINLNISLNEMKGGIKKNGVCRSL